MRGLSSLGKWLVGNGTNISLWKDGLVGRREKDTGMYANALDWWVGSGPLIDSVVGDPPPA